MKNWMNQIVFGMYDRLCTVVTNKYKISLVIYVCYLNSFTLTIIIFWSFQ
jgi:hypothetical protein